ncbi:MAG: hypothetical protein OHK93_006806 [Ramalina farinacea]|uniref:Uncharacterized protein n=1 Tax=Ramalina farinacea TaxID=258253 RepID=A0AA43QJ90_9LECA|nr:hypothetical protein [Ramalina farinacea]
MSSTTTTTKSSSSNANSEFLSHLTSYPTISTSIDTYKSYPLGRRSIELSHTSYTKFLSPLLSYTRPYQGYFAPYLSRADTLASSGLDKIDTRFPILTEPPSKIKDQILDLGYTPLRLASDGKTYVLDTYGAEYDKCGPQGSYVTSSKALVTTSMVVTSDALAYLSSLFSKGKAQGEDLATRGYKRGEGLAQNGYNSSKEYAAEAYGFVGGKAAEAKGYASEKAEEVKGLAYEKEGEVKGMAREGKKKVDEKTAH